MAIHDNKSTNSAPLDWMQKNYPRGNFIGGLFDASTEPFSIEWKNSAFSLWTVGPAVGIANEKWIIDSIDVLIVGVPNIPGASGDIVLTYPEGFRSSYTLKVFTISTQADGIKALLAAMQVKDVTVFTHNSVNYIKGKLNLGQIVIDSSETTAANRQMTIGAMNALGDALGSIIFTVRGWKVLIADY